jgi:hypothetical protein
VPAIETQAVLREAFEGRGLPRRIRVDNGTPWRSKGDLPTDLELWLSALGVEVVANPPRRPQDNGVVERSQGTGKRWAEPHRAASAEELQVIVDLMDRRQREAYPYRRQASRRAAHPALEHSGRVYDRSREQELLSVGRSRDLLAGFVVPRRVDQSGMASVYGRNYYVGKAYAGRLVYVRYDPQAELWLFQDEAGHQLNRREASEINAANIGAMAVTNRRDRSRPSGPGELPVGIIPAQPDVA